jgi:hypothetical protein
MLKTLMFCHVEDNNTIPGLENKITEPDLKKVFKTVLVGKGVAYI